MKNRDFRPENRHFQPQMDANGGCFPPTRASGAPKTIGMEPARPRAGLNVVTRLTAPGYSGKNSPKSRKTAPNGPNLSRRRRERLFGLFFTCAARCGSFPIRKPPLAKDAKDAKKLSRNLTPLGALCDLCERNCPKKCRFSGRTCHAEGVNAFSDSFSPVRPVVARFRSENRLSPRTPRTRRSFRGISRRLAPFAIFAREIVRKNAGFQAGNRDFSSKLVTPKA